MHYIDTKLKAKQVEDFLKAHDYDVALASERFGITRATIYRYIKNFGLEFNRPPAQRDPETGRFKRKSTLNN